MSSIFSELGGITAGTAAEGLAFAAGFAAARALEPAAVTISQDAWNAAPVRRLPPDIAAEAAAENYAALATMTDEASYSGMDASRFAYLYDVTLTAPGLGTLLSMYRRGTISTGNLEHGFAKQKYEPMWTTPLEDLANVYIGIGDIATGIVRGVFPSPSYLPVAPPTSGLSVPRFPQVNIDPEALAAKLGYSAEMLQAMVGRSGLSLAPIFAANAFFRGIINEQDFLLAIAEGDLRTEWATTLRDAAREIPTAGQMMEHALRGFETVASAQANAQRHGMVAADSQLVYDNLGRAPSGHAITTGLARGGVYDGTAQTAPEPYLSAFRRGNLRPEYYSIEYANRYTYPSAFVLRALAQAGELGDDAAVEQILLDIGWPPAMATSVAASWTGGGTTGDTHESKAQTQLWGTIHRSYLAGEITEAQAQAALPSAGVAAGSVAGVLSTWNVERGLIRKQLSPAQVKKAFTEGTFTLAQAEAELTGRGYDAADAATFLNE